MTSPDVGRRESGPEQNEQHQPAGESRRHTFTPVEGGYIFTAREETSEPPYAEWRLAELREGRGPNDRIVTVTFKPADLDGHRLPDWTHDVIYTDPKAVDAYAKSVEEAVDRARPKSAAKGPWWNDVQAMFRAVRHAETDTGHDTQFVPDEDEQHSWPEPMDPIAFHGVLGDIAKAMAPETEADPIAILGMLLVQYGIACGDGAGTHKGDLHRAKEQIVLVGNTSMARKGTAWGVASSVMRAAYPELDSLMWPGLGSGEGIPGKLERNQKEAQPGEAAEYRGLIYEGEFARLLTAMSRDSNTLSPQLRNAWDDVPIGRMLSRDQASATRHHIGLVGHITNVELANTMKSVDASNGFGNRMLFLAVRRTQVLTDPGIATEICAKYIPRLKQAITDGSRVRWMKFDDEARKLWAEFYLAESRRPHMGLAGDITARHAPHVVRLSLIYAMADGEDQYIRPVHLRAAIAFADYARRSAVYIFGTSTGHKDADALLRLLRREEEVGRTEAWDELGTRSAAKLDDAVDVLVRLGLAERGERKRADGRGGRPKQVIRLKVPNSAKSANLVPPLQEMQPQTAAPLLPEKTEIGRLSERLQVPRGFADIADIGNGNGEKPVPDEDPEPSPARPSPACEDCGQPDSYHLLLTGEGENVSLCQRCYRARRATA